MPAPGRRLGRAEVGVVGRDDRQVVDPLGLGQRGLALDQRLPAGIAPGEEQLAGRGERLVGLAPQGAGGQLGRVVHQDRPAVRPAEEVGRTAPPDHPHPQLALAHRRRPSLVSLANPGSTPRIRMRSRPRRSGSRTHAL